MDVVERRRWNPKWKHVMESTSIWLIVVYMFVMPLETLQGLPPTVYSALAHFDTIVTALFVAEYCARIWAEERKRDYILSFYGIVDFLAIFPALILPIVGMQEFRALRLLRLFRFVKAWRYSAAALRFTNALWESKEEIAIFFAGIGIVLYIAAVGIYHFEHEAQPDVFQSVFHALWWAVMTVTTVGYGDVYPITTGGRIFTSIVVLLALGIVAVPAGILASALSKVRVREMESDQEGDSRSTTSTLKGEA